MKYLIPIFIISLFACSKSQETNTDFTKIVLIDTFDNELILDIKKTREDVIFHPLYIGKHQKEIILEYFSNIVDIPHYYPHVTYKHQGSMKLKEVNYREPGSNDLKIFIDTSKVIGSAIISKVQYKCYPVFIENI